MTAPPRRNFEPRTRGAGLSFTWTGVGWNETTAWGGIELAQDAARLRSNIPVLYTTGDQLTDGMQAMFVERSAFLPKPYTPEQSIRFITEILREQPN